MSAIQRWHVIVRGRVQGVWFRASTRDKAMELGLTGWVRNLADGSVEAEFQGPPEQAQAMRQWLWTGSPLSAVTGVTATPLPPVPDEQGFVIRR